MKNNIEYLISREDRNMDSDDEELQATREMNGASRNIETSIINLKEYIEKDPYYNGTYKPTTDFEKFCYDHCRDISNLLKRNKELEEKHRNVLNKLNEDISDDNCMWVNNQEKIVKTAKTIIDRSNYAKEILELLEERN